MEEEWRDAVGYEGLYKISNLGNVKSLKCNREKIMRASGGGAGYLNVVLYLNNIKKTKAVHQLVAEAFLNHKPCGHNLVVNHINFDKIDNSVDNLEIVTNRENSNLKHIKSLSKYTGVTWQKANKKWVAQIVVNGKLKYLGCFIDELEASNRYKKELILINNK